MEHSCPLSISCCHQFSFSSSLLSLLRLSTCTSTALPPFLAFLVAGACASASSASFLFFLPESQVPVVPNPHQWETTAKFLKSHQKWWPSSTRNMAPPRHLQMDAGLGSLRQANKVPNKHLLLVMTSTMNPTKTCQKTYSSHHISCLLYVNIHLPHAHLNFSPWNIRFTEWSEFVNFNPRNQRVVRWSCKI